MANLGLDFADSDERVSGGITPPKPQVPVVICNSCGGRTTVKSTIRGFNVCIRYRKCEDCGQTVKTVGMITP